MKAYRATLIVCALLLLGYLMVGSEQQAASLRRLSPYASPESKRVPTKPAVLAPPPAALALLDALDGPGGPDLAMPVAALATGSMGPDIFPARDAYLVTDHPQLSVSNGRAFDVFERPAYIFVAIRVPRRDMPEDRCVLVTRWQSQGIGQCYYRQTFAVGTSDWLVVPVAMDNVAPQAVAARVEGGRQFLWPTPIGELPPMMYEELEHVR